MPEKHIYYGASNEVLGPFAPGETSAQANAMRQLELRDRQVYKILAVDFRDALIKLSQAQKADFHGR